MDDIIHIPNYIENNTILFNLILQHKIKWVKNPYFKKNACHYIHTIYMN